MTRTPVVHLSLRSVTCSSEYEFSLSDQFLGNGLFDVFHIKSIEGVMFHDVILEYLIKSFTFCFLVTFLST